MKIVLLVLTSCISQILWANWTFNLGYQNPPGALVGANLFYFGSSWGAEVGIGGIDVDTLSKNNDKENSETQENTWATTIGGDVNIKYFLTPGKIRPYMQGGLGLGISATAGKDSNAHAGTGKLFGGIGLMGGSPSFYAYVSAVIMNITIRGLFQAGIGIDL